MDQERVGSATRDVPLDDIMDLVYKITIGIESMGTPTTCLFTREQEVFFDEVCLLFDKNRSEMIRAAVDVFMYVLKKNGTIDG